jgi:hypothetical protein
MSPWQEFTRPESRTVQLKDLQTLLDKLRKDFVECSSGRVGLIGASQRPIASEQCSSLR